MVDTYSWDRQVNAKVADNDLETMVQLMLSGMSAADAFDDSSVNKIDADHWGAVFQEYMNQVANYYIPAWVDLKISGVPPVYTRVDVLFTAAKWWWQKTGVPNQTPLELNNNLFSMYNFAVPDNVVIRVTGHTADGKIAWCEHPFTFHPGENDIAFAFTAGAASSATTVTPPDDDSGP